MNVLIITCIVATGFGFAAGYHVASNEADARELKRVHAAQAAYHEVENQYEDAAWELEAARAELATQRATTARALQTITARPSYQRDCLDDDGVRLINDAIAKSTNSREPAFSVPAPSATPVGSR